MAGAFARDKQDKGQFVNPRKGGTAELQELSGKHSIKQDAEKRSRRWLAQRTCVRGASRRINMGHSNYVFTQDFKIVYLKESKSNMGASVDHLSHLQQPVFMTVLIHLF